MPTVELLICLGHKASLKQEIWDKFEKKRAVTPGEFTHDWEFYIKDIKDGNMEYYIDKVIVHLHETFKKPTRGEMCTVVFQ